MDAVLQPDGLALGQHLLRVVHRHHPPLAPVLGGRAVLLAGRHDEHWALDFPVEFRGVVVPQGFDDPQVVGAAEPGPDRLVFQDFEIGQNDVGDLGGHAVARMPRAHPFQETVRPHPGKVRRGHLKLGVLDARIPG